MNIFSWRMFLTFLPLLLASILSGCGGGGSDDAPAPTPTPTVSGLSVGDTSAAFDATTINVNVNLSPANTTETVTVDYATVDGTAVAGTDYIAKTGTLTFSPGDTSKTVTINLQAGRDSTTTTMFHLSLSNPTNSTITDNTAVLSLLGQSDSAMFSNTTAIANWGDEGVFTSSSKCATCHTAGTNTQSGASVMYNATEDVSPFTKWKHSTMANSLNDPYFNAVVEEEGHVFPDKKVFIEDTCMRCHAPMAYTHAHQTVTGLVTDPTALSADGGYPFATAIADNSAREGVACTACHQIQPDNLGNEASMSGHYTIKSEADNNGTRPNNLSTQRPDVASGDDANSFFGVHEFVGGNSYLLTLLKTYMNELGLGSASGHTAQGFTDKITATQQFLSQAADIAVTPSLVGSTLNVPVKITNKTGHKLPTSYPSRRMWVHIKVTDTNGSTVFESGAVDSNGRIAKDANFTASKCLEMNKQPDPATFDSLAEGCYEPHHDIINSADQVAIYEGVLGDVNQDITHVLLHARQYIKDNRIPPTGWTLAGQHTNPADTNIKDDGIVGFATTDTNFAPGKDTTGSDASDTVTYEINVSAGLEPFTVTTELYYQTIKPSFVYAMHADDVAHGGIAGDSYVGRFKEMYEQTPPLTETLASQTVSGIQ